MSTTAGPSEAPGQQPIYLTTQDVAELLRTSAATVSWWRHIGYGPSGVRVGRRVLYSAKSVAAWVDALPSGGKAS